MPELTKRAVEMAEGVGWLELFLGVDGDVGDGVGAAAAAVVVVVEEDEEEGDVDREVDDEWEDIIWRTRNRIVACWARTLRSERIR